jgi:phospholipase/lecithinase/hemolysin
MTLFTLFRTAAGATATAAGLLLASTSALALVASPPSSFSSLVVFGDSLSDNGNLFALTGGTVPASPYYQGRFSNGPVAVERLASGLGLGGAQFRDLAIAGAQTGTGGVVAGTGMLSQLAGFQAALGGGQADGNALYVVWGGANDLRGGVSIGTAIGNLSSLVSSLHTLGARKFLLPNLPDLGLTPEAREAGGSALATFASEAFNTNLSLAYGTMAAQWTDETFYYLYAMGAQRALSAGAPGNGFSNVSNRCFDSRVPSLCATPDSYLYWDNIHPTAAVHQILGDQMLAAVPEPQTMLMMALGLLALLALRRRQG